MFYEVVIEDIVRIPPEMLRYDKENAVLETLRAVYPSVIKKDIGMIISVIEVLEIGEGVMIPEDGGVYYKVKFKVLTFKPELNELVIGSVVTIADFGIFVNLGPLDGLVHISQVMDDEVSVSSKEAIVGKTTKRVLKLGDVVRARVISVSYKDPTTIRIALTMRQPGLGKLDWIYEKKK